MRSPFVNFPARVPLARLPTPLEASPRLGADLGIELLYKRDDLTGLELSGNKARKLELLLAEAEAERADTLVTCGGIQSNHCRATAFAAAKRGLSSVVVLRVPDPSRPPALEANSLLDELAGAEIRFVSHAGYARRIEVMAAIADELRAARRRPYVIPEGGSNALGSMGYALAVAELRDQLPESWRDETVVLAYAAGSGGTGAGIEMGVRLARWSGARPLGFAVCNDAGYFVRTIAALCSDARRRWPVIPAVPEAEISIEGGFIGPGYAQATPEGLDLIRRAARADGVLLDPVYTGKAMLGVAALARDGRLASRRVVLFHTGGAFGLFPFAAQLSA